MIRSPVGCRCDAPGKPPLSHSWDLVQTGFLGVSSAAAAFPIRVMGSQLLLTALLSAAEPPMIVSITPDGESASADIVIQHGSLTVNGTADAGSSVQLLIGPTAGPLVNVGARTLAASGSWSISLPARSDGRYLLQAQATPTDGAVMVSARTVLLIDAASSTPATLGEKIIVTPDIHAVAPFRFGGKWEGRLPASAQRPTALKTDR